MPFAYYDKLTPAEQTIYRASDGCVAVVLPDGAPVESMGLDLYAALVSEDRAAVELVASRLCRAITDALAVDPVGVEVLAVRPRWDTAELHGLYTRTPDEPPRIQVWMRTAHHRRVVAFRTFLRTLIHELCHHLDFTYLELPHSYHTEGFFKRESSLVNQIAPRREEDKAEDGTAQAALAEAPAEDVREAARETAVDDAAPTAPGVATGPIEGEVLAASRA